MGRVLADPEDDDLPDSALLRNSGRESKHPEKVRPLHDLSSNKQADSAPSGPGEFIGRAGDVNLYAAGDLASASEAWRAFQSSALYTPFQDVDWNLCWMQAAGKDQGYQPLIVFGYLKDQLCFIMPLSLVVKFGLCRLSWLGQPLNDYNAPLLAPRFAEHCSEELVEEIWTVVSNVPGIRGQIDLFDFRQQPSNIAGQPNPFVGVGAQPSSCNAHQVDLRPGWKSYYEEARGSKSRKRLRDKENGLSKLGTLQFKSEKDPAARRQLIKVALQWKLAQLSASGDRHPFSPDTNDVEAGSAVQRTLLALCDLPEMRHKLRIEGLYVAGEPVALIVAMVMGGRYSVFITAHSGGVSSQYSPGKILLVKSIQLACRARYRKYDLLAGDEEYKLSWCDETTHLWSRAVGLTLKGKAVVPVIRSARMAKKRLKQNPRVFGLLKSLNRRRLMLS